ncbi:Rxlr effector protein, partial [Globisporangium splendens]
MAAKALQAPIFLVVESEKRTQASYTLYKPVVKSFGAVKINTAGEYLLERKDWSDALRRARDEAVADKKPLPIVLKFTPEHYSSLLYTRLETKTTPPKFTSALQEMVGGSGLSASTKGADESRTQGNKQQSEKHSTGTTTANAIVIEDEEGKMEDNEESRPRENKNWRGSTDDLQAALNDPDVAHHEKQQIMNITAHGGGRKGEVTTATFSGVEHLSAAEQEALSNLDLEHDPAAEHWMHKFRVSSVTLQKWQLQARELLSQVSAVRQSTPTSGSPRTPTSSQTSTGKRDHETTPVDKGHHGQTVVNVNNPAVPLKKSKTQTRELVKSAPTMRERKLQLKTRVLVYGRRGSNMDEGSHSRLANGAGDAASLTWTTRDPEQREKVHVDRINSNAARATHLPRFGELERENNGERNARMDPGLAQEIGQGHQSATENRDPRVTRRLGEIEEASVRTILCAVLFKEEIQTMVAPELGSVGNTYDLVRTLLEAMKSNPALTKAFKTGEDDGEWTALAEYFANMGSDVKDITPKEHGDLFAAVRAMKAAFFKPKQRTHELLRNDCLKICTQNVCGFKKTRRLKWLEALKHQTTAKRADVIFLQETRVKYEREASELTAHWNRLWGFRQNTKGTAFFSIDESGAGGVAFLINPKKLTSVTPVAQGQWTNRFIAIEGAECVWANVYAPNARREQDEYFSELHQILSNHSNKLVMAGDFNCVLDTRRDRLGTRHRGPARCENRKLKALVEDLGLHDAHDILCQDAEQVRADPADFFTFWKDRSASRIDRFYIAAEIGHFAQECTTRMPVRKSDHQAVILTMTAGKKVAERQKYRKTCAYQISSPSPEEVAERLSHRIEGILEHCNEQSQAEWEKTREMLTQAVEVEARRERAKQRRSARKQKDRSAINRTATRAELLAAREAMSDAAADLSYGAFLQSSQHDVRHFFQRVSNWLRDQSISDLTPEFGEQNPGECLADVMADGWSAIFGQTHATVTGRQREQLFDKLLSVPRERHITKEWNQVLMSPICEEEVKRAVKALQRFKAGGLDGLNNDFYKDCTEALLPLLVAEYNRILQGGKLPPSFLEGLVIPLRKNGDSSNPRDYRPITLLPSSYKIFASVMATRLQQYLGSIIGATQQGFVKSRLMERSVVLMQAVLAQAQENPVLPMGESAGVVLLDIMKAYDMLDRSFLLLVLQKFGFCQDFVDLIGRMHDGTTARFLVNGELSKKRKVVSGIRQGCPLAPLLFIIAVETLALAVDQCTSLQGITIGGAEERRLKISAFMDDSAIFLSRGAELKPLLELLQRFGTVSGLHAQPAKSCYISLNTSATQVKVNGITVIQHGDTVRYLGVQVGTADAVEANWNDRLSKLRSRLVVATQITNTIPGRIMILNAILLPAVLFTASYSKPQPETIRELERVQKQFLWHQSLSAEPARHKVSPALLFTPIGAGGMGLLSIPLALKRQAMKRATTWMMAPEDEHTAAWHALVHPEHPQQISCYILQRELDRVKHDWDNKRFLLTRDSTEMPHSGELTAAAKAFWPTFKWQDNAWIIDQKGEKLRRRDHAFSKDCTISNLCITRHSRLEYSCNAPCRSSEWTKHRERKWKHALLSIIVCAPELAIGESMMVNQDHELWHKEDLANEYIWRMNGMGQARGTTTVEEKTRTITMRRQSDGVLWAVESWDEETTVEADANKL